MINVIVDKLRYCAVFDNDVLVEGYQGYRVEENIEGIKFVIYKEIVEEQENERRFVLPDNTLDSFMKLSDKYVNFFEKQKFLFKMLVNVEQTLQYKNEDNLRAVCNELYSIPANYVHFVAMNMTKGQFFSLARERILNYQNSLELN
jgi:hypothetical protein